MGQRKQFTAGFKAKVAVEAIKGQRTAQEIGSIYGVHPTQVTTWKRQLVAQASEIFTRAGIHDNDAIEQEHRYHLYPNAEWIRVSGRHSGLVQPLRCGLGSLDHAGHQLLPVNARPGSGESEARDLQFRSRLPVHQCRVYSALGGCPRSDQHGWTWPRAGQHFHRAVVAYRQVRRGLLEGLYRCAGRDWEFESLLSFLQPAASAPGIELSDSGSCVLRRECHKNRHAQDRPCCRSSFFRKSRRVMPRHSVHASVSCGNGSMLRGDARPDSLIPTPDKGLLAGERNNWSEEGRAQAQRPRVSSHAAPPAVGTATCKNSSWC